MLKEQLDCQLRVWVMILKLKTLLWIGLLTAALCGQVQAQNGFTAEQQPNIQLPGLQDFTPTANPAQDSATAISVALEAVLLDEGAPIQTGLIWRVFDPTPDEEGKLRLVVAAEGGSTSIDFEPGDYFVHVAFGRASVTKKLSVTSDSEIPPQRFILDAGGIILKAASGENTRLSPSLLDFSIYSGEQDSVDDSDRQLILEFVKPNLIVRLNEGTYHVVSKYGDVNAVTRADVRVEKGKLTEVQMNHRAAEVTFKLVSKQGGEGIADTAWAVYSSSGDIIGEMVGAFPRLVLSEGDYTVIALHQNAEYPLDFHVSPGKNSDVEVLLAN